MRMPPLPADSIHARACKLKCEKILTRPTFRCGYFYAYREDFTYPAEVNSACAKVFECPHPIRTVYMRLADRGV